MPIVVTSPINSFLTFEDTTYLTESNCGIVKPWCFPVYDDADIKFQFHVELADFTFEPDNFLMGIKTDTTTYNPVPVNVNVNQTTGREANIQINFVGTGILDVLNTGDCFTFNLFFQENPDIRPLPPPTLIGTIQQCFQKISDPCFTSRLIYLNNEDAFGFVYPSSWANIIRLPVYFKNPTVEAEQKVYVRSDGTRKLLSSRLSKNYLGLVDHSTEEIHQKLVVALSHDSVNFLTDNNYYMTCTFENEYTNDFNQEPMPINVWPANFTVYETPFDNINSNCI